MLCPKCGVQTHELNNGGDGSNDGDYYITATPQECPVCGCRFLEVYGVYEIETVKTFIFLQYLKMVLENIYNKLSKSK